MTAASGFILISARYMAFGNDEPFSQQHLLQAVDETVPLSQTMADRIDYLRTWATHRARNASSVKPVEAKDSFMMRTLEIEKSEEKQC